jgi:protein-S-isoprenylcysteine O-methyltransferase Ste14
LAQSGIYRKSRNPQALACGLYVLGFTVLWPLWYALGWAILYAILIHIMIITEEEHLLRAHGEGYVKYGRDVPRYFSLRSWNSPETTI